MSGSDETRRYALVWLSDKSIGAPTIVPIRRAIEDGVKEPREEVEVDVWLESPGGDAHAAFKLALMLRHVAARVRVVVPDYAKSAATLLALAGQEIFLGPGAELGPLDAQMPEEGSLEGFISALNIARAADEVAQDAVELAEQGALELFHLTGLSRAETIESMLKFSANFYEPLLRQLDPRVVYHAKQMLRVTKQYAERLLTDVVPGDRPSSIAAGLVEEFPTHGYVICYGQAKRLGLPVLPLAEYDLHEDVTRLHRAAEDGNDLIWFAPMDEVLSAGGDTDGNDEANGDQGGLG